MKLTRTTGATGTTLVIGGTFNGVAWRGRRLVLGHIPALGGASFLKGNALCIRGWIVVWVRRG